MCYSAPNVFITERWRVPWIVLAAHRWFISLISSASCSCFPPCSYCTSAHAGTGAHARRHVQLVRCCRRSENKASADGCFRARAKRIYSSVTMVTNTPHTRLYSLTLSLSCLSRVSLSLCLCNVYQEYDPSWKCYCPAFWFTESSGTFYTRTYTLPCYLNEDTSRHLLFFM